MVDSKHDVINKPQKHDWTFFAFFAIALILIASAIVWASVRAGMFNSANADDDTPARIELPPIPLPASSDSTKSSDETDGADKTQAPDAARSSEMADSPAGDAAGDEAAKTDEPATDTESH